MKTITGLSKEARQSKNKENALSDFLDMIAKSWTFDRLTTQEKLNVLEAFKDSALFGDYYQRWQILENVYHSFLCALGYKENPVTWRDPNPETATKF